MNFDQAQKWSIAFLKTWWPSLLMLPFILYSIHQVYWAIVYNIFFAVNYNYPFPLDLAYLFVDTFLLIVHEAGHTFFSLLGIRVITIVGGSLLQILLPFTILGYFWINRKKIGIQLSLALLGFSWLDVAIYASDGSARQLPLIGGLGKESHDWYNLLIRMDSLEYDITFGIAFFIIGILCYLAALLIPLFYKEYEKIDINLELE